MDTFDQSSHRICVECASLPYTADVPLSLCNGRRYDFAEIYEYALSHEELMSVCDGNPLKASTDGPEIHQLMIVRLKYSTDGGRMWSQYSNNEHIRYSPKLELMFDPNRAGYSLRFGPEGRTVECTQHDDLYHTALFGIEVTSSMCSVFRIKFKVHKFAATKQKCDFFIGFLVGSTLDNYDQALGCGSNKELSTGIRVSGKKLFLHNPHHSKTEIIYDMPSDRIGFREDDTFRWTFNFKKGYWTLFHGNKSVLKQKMSAQSIVPGVSLGNQGETIGVVSWKFQ